MGLRAHAVASSDGWLRSLFWFLLICSNFGYTDQIHNFLDLPFDDPLNLSPAMLRNHHRIRRQEKDCSPGRQFICYAYDGLDEPYPEWLQNTDAKCEKCKTDSVCKDTDKVETATDDVRPQVKKSCRPNLCVSRHSDKYKTDGFEFTTKYLVQCDAGFVVPRLVADAARQVDPNNRPAFTCVPSLQQAAGFLKEDRSLLYNDPYDVPDLMDFTYCGMGGRPENSSCEPLPLCDPTTKQPPESPFSEDLVKRATECDVPCEHRGANGSYDDCVFLDILDPDAKILYTAKRAHSGPYAQFMSEEENLRLDVIINTTVAPANQSDPAVKPEANSLRILNKYQFNHAQALDDEGGRRVRRQSMTEQVIRYPKCIDINGLSTYDRNRVEADLMLDCRTNVFFKASGAGGLKMTPPSCDGDDDVRICKGRTEPTTIAPSASGPNEDESELGLRLAVAAAVVGICLLAAVVTVGVLYKQKRIFYHQLAEPLPQHHVAANVELAWQPYGGSWEARFYRKVTGQPPKVKPSSLGYSLKGHLALGMKSEKLNPGVPWPLNGKGCPIPSTNEPIRDPVVVAETLLSALAQDNLVTVYNCGPTKLFDNNDLIALFNHAKSMQAQVKSVVHLTGPTWVVGDIHGDFNVLWRMFDAYGRTALPGQNIVFLGDVVDRGARQMMCLVLIVASMVLHPKQVFYVAGNHETPYCYNQYGFSTQIKDEQKYSAETFAAIEGFFKSLPRVGTIDKRILVVHGGIPPRMTTEQLRNGFDPNDESAELTRLRLSLQWNDPCNVEADGAEWPYNTSRGCAQYFNKQMIDDFRAKHGIDFIIRAHQSVPTGVSFFGNWLISLFTTPHKDSFGAILRYDGNKFTFLHIIPPTLDVTDVASLDHCFAQAMGFKPFEPESQQQNPAEKAPVAPEEQRTERIQLAAPAAPAATK
ncbi:unnamed protein product, partial [Mesorhabditis spiculigera]